MTEEQLIEALKKALEESLPASTTHREDHEFLHMLKAREARRLERVEKFKLSAIGGLGIAVVSGLIWVGKIIIEYLGHHIK